MGKKGHLTFQKGHLIFGEGCVRTPRTPPGTPLTLGRKISTDVLEKVDEICAESNLEILDSNVDRAHLIGTN